MKAKKKGSTMQIVTQERVGYIPFSELQPGEQFKLPNDDATIQLGILTKAGPGGFTSYWDGYRFGGNSRTERGNAVTVGKDCPVERIKMP